MRVEVLEGASDPAAGVALPSATSLFLPSLLGVGALGGPHWSRRWS